MAGDNILHDGTNDGERIDAGVIIEPPVLPPNQDLPQPFRNLMRRCSQTPDTIRCEKCMQEPSISVLDYEGVGFHRGEGKKEGKEKKNDTRAKEETKHPETDNPERGYVPMRYAAIRHRSFISVWDDGEIALSVQLPVDTNCFIPRPPQPTNRKM
jgi:hypothetical protein